MVTEQDTSRHLNKLLWRCFAVSVALRDSNQLLKIPHAHGLIIMVHAKSYSLFSLWYFFKRKIVLFFVVVFCVRATPATAASSVRIETECAGCAADDAKVLPR